MKVSKIVKLFGHPYLWVKGCYYNIASLYGSYAGMISIPAIWWFQPLEKMLVKMGSSSPRFGVNIKTI